MTRDGSFRLRAEHPRAVKAGGETPAPGAALHTPAPGCLIRERELDGGERLLEVAGELDLSSAPRLKWALAAALEDGAREIIVDLSRVGFIDSTALGVLVGAQRSLHGGARMAIACPHAHLMRILELTGLDGTFEIFPTLDGALAHCRGSAAPAG
jgi:anti-sigma B factor antagonist